MWLSSQAYRLCKMLQTTHNGEAILSLLSWNYRYQNLLKKKGESKNSHELRESERENHDLSGSFINQKQTSLRIDGSPAEQYKEVEEDILMCLDN